MQISNQLKQKFLQLLKEVIIYNSKYPNDLEMEETLKILQDYLKQLYNPLSN